MEPVYITHAVDLYETCVLYIVMNVTHKRKEYVKRKIEKGDDRIL